MIMLPLETDSSWNSRAESEKILEFAARLFYKSLQVESDLMSQSQCGAYKSVAEDPGV